MSLRRKVKMSRIQREPQPPKPLRPVHVLTSETTCLNRLTVTPTQLLALLIRDGYGVPENPHAVSFTEFDSEDGIRLEWAGDGDTRDVIIDDGLPRGQDAPRDPDRCACGASKKPHMWACTECNSSAQEGF